MSKGIFSAFAGSILFFCITTSALAGSYRDWQNGNVFSWNDYGNSTNVRGHNLNTGAQWSATYNANGKSNGIDKDGNLWNYDSRTGHYSNSNGTTCYGKGMFRQCY